MRLRGGVGSHSASWVGAKPNQGPEEQTRTRGFCMHSNPEVDRISVKQGTYKVLLPKIIFYLLQDGCVYMYTYVHACIPTYIQPSIDVRIHVNVDAFAFNRAPPKPRCCVICRSIFKFFLSAVC